jgi:hypothetical protein
VLLAEAKYIDFGLVNLGKNLKPKLICLYFLLFVEANKKESLDADFF